MRLDELEKRLADHDENQAWSLGIMRGYNKVLLGDVGKFIMAVFKKHDIGEMLAVIKKTVPGISLHT